MVVAPTMPNDIKERIQPTSTEITPQMLAEVSRSFESDYSDMFRFFDYFHTLRD